MTTIMPLLYQSGYITIKNYDPETELYTLALPNKEVRIGLYRSMLPHYLAAKSAMCNTTVAKMSSLINKGNMDGALQLLKTFWETVPYCDKPIMRALSADNVYHLCPAYEFPYIGGTAYFPWKNRHYDGNKGYHLCDRTEI